MTRTRLPGALIRMEREVQDAMQALIDAKLVTVRRESMWLEIEINTDILFPSGVGRVLAGGGTGARQAGGGAQAVPQSDPRRRPHRRSADQDRGIPLQLGTVGGARRERGASNSPRQGIDPLRLEIVGFGEFHPRQTNTTAEGRNANRRVAVLVLEAVTPAEATTARTTTDTPQTVAPGVELADAEQRHQSAARARAARGYRQDRIDQRSETDGRRITQISMSEVTQ